MDRGSEAAERSDKCLFMVLIRRHLTALKIQSSRRENPPLVWRKSAAAIGCKEVLVAAETRSSQSWHPAGSADEMLFEVMRPEAMVSACADRSGMPLDSSRMRC